MAETRLRRFRVGDDLWEASERPCLRLAPIGGRSEVARNALARAVAYETDPLLKKVLALAEERGTTVEQVERAALTSYVKRIESERNRRST